MTLAASAPAAGVVGRFRVQPVAQRGFTYVVLLFAVAIAGALLAGTGVLWRTDGVREREVELLFVGGEYQRALESYFQATPQIPNRYPKSLQELLEDRRGPVVRRHLRRLYPDPFTGQPDWVLVRAPDGSIVGLHSSSESAPIKRADPYRPFAFAKAKTHRDWVFRARNAEQLAAAAVPGRQPVGGIGMPLVPAGESPGMARSLASGAGSVPAPESGAPDVAELENPPSKACVAQRVADGRVCQALGGDVGLAARCLIAAGERFLACEQGLPAAPLGYR